MPQNFNPRSHEGSDGHGTASLRRQHNFNPRSHEGSDIIRLAESLGMRISIRAPARGATTVSVCAEFSGSNFNPRSREGSDIDWVSNPLCNAISIRTPARGATRTWTRLPRLCRFQSALPRGERHGASVEYKPTMTTISIRAPARGATTVSVCAEFSGSNFNPRSREGSDAWQKADWLYYQISIRAPARGATGRPCQLLYVKGFQSALPRGERHNMVGYCQSHRDFNPRSREGSDDGTQLSVRYGCYFNPRSREGSD